MVDSLGVQLQSLAKDPYMPEFMLNLVDESVAGIIPDMKQEVS